MIYNFLLFITLFIFSGCSNINSPKPQKQELPYWMKNETILSNNLAVGYSIPVFGGVYAQRQNALHDAKEKLSQNIKSTISSNKNEKINLFNNQFSINSIQNIKAVSKLLLNDIKIYDTYINASNELFLLIGLPDAKVKLKKKQIKPFNKKDLKSSTCYNQKILNSINTSSTIYKDKPLWFYSQNLDNAIGIAEKIDENFEMQKKTAILLAKTNLVKKTNSYSLSKRKMLQMLKHNEEAVLLDTKSITKSNQKLNSFHIKDIWINPKTCELYVFICATH